jgi:manganese transport protein
VKERRKNMKKIALLALITGAAAAVFAIALLLAGLSSTITAGMAGGSIFAGIFSKPYDIKDRHTKAGVLITTILGAALVFIITSPFKGLIYSQMVLSIQLPVTVFTQLFLTSSKKVMGRYAASGFHKALLWAVALIVTFFNIALLFSE